MYLAGDIGGTKTILALFSREAGPHTPLVETVFPSGRYIGLGEIIAEFLHANPTTIEGASFGVAGPVVNGRAAITNLPWEIDSAALQAQLGVGRVVLLNDLEAIAYAVPILEPEDLLTLSAGRPEAGGAIGVIAPGTGLGEAFLTWNGRAYQANPSEGGHASFAPTTEHERGLLDYMLQRHSHVSFERVCSGLGIPNIYAYFRDRVHGSETPAVAAQLAASKDATPVIVNAALAEQPCPVCRDTMLTFVDILGSEAGNLALKVMATGGVYIGGGIPPRIIPLLTGGRLVGAMRRKGRFGDLVATMPVHIIENPKAALLGAAAAALA